MISPNVLQFLEFLKKNNNREWFRANKPLYEEAKVEVESFVNQLIPAVRKFDNEIGILSPKDCMFRIYRDVRFSKDKSPYKINFGGFITKGGRRAGNAGYYLHIEPQNSFLGGGIYMPAGASLKAIRQEIYYNIDEFRNIINDNDFIKNFRQLEGEKLVRPPKDFPPDFEEIELLKFKSYVVLHPLSDKILLSEDLQNFVIKIFKSMLSLNHFINRALE